MTRSELTEAEMAVKLAGSPTVTLDAQPLMSEMALRLEARVRATLKTKRRSGCGCKESPRAGKTRDHCICIVSFLVVLGEHSGRGTQRKDDSGVLRLRGGYKGTRGCLADQVRGGAKRRLGKRRLGSEISGLVQAIAESESFS